MTFEAPIWGCAGHTHMGGASFKEIMLQEKNRTCVTSYLKSQLASL